MNKLAKEKSPYLLQHAHNPVEWFPWEDEAFEKAKKEVKPIFLSIGYSTCHWCHVMEEESFNDKNVAQVLNAHFVAIKVDREERPDIDAAYMDVCHAMTGQGGWPLTIIMTPDKKPFFAGTYFPKLARYGQPGIMQFLLHIAELWKTRKKELLQSADSVLALLDAAQGIQEEEKKELAEEKLHAHKPQRDTPLDTLLGKDIMQHAYNSYNQQFDSSHGGFGTAPKFPTPMALLFLLRYWKKTQESTALRIIEKTLFAIALGGIHDHLGGGFHRYSTDAQWRVPHYEKMLYDQALLAMVYTEVFQATHKKEYQHIAEEILSYVLRDMASPEGGFYTAEDADSYTEERREERGKEGGERKKEEGAFYLWTKKEIDTLLGKEARLFCEWFNIREEGNLGEGNKNILYLQNHIDRDFHTDFHEQRKKLFLAREKRQHPFKDDKILADWNGLMLAALAKAARVFRNDVSQNEKYKKAAEQTALFILQNMTKEGRLFHCYRKGVLGARTGFAEDYACVAWGLLELYETTGDTGYMQNAREMISAMLSLFWDKQSGGFFSTAVSDEIILKRRKDLQDGAAPSANSVAFLVMNRLALFEPATSRDATTGDTTTDTAIQEKIQQMLKAFAKSIGESPSVYPFFLTGLDIFLGPNYLVKYGTETVMKELQHHYLPNLFCMKEKRKDIALCTKGRCLPPVHDVQALLLMLSNA